MAIRNLTADDGRALYDILSDPAVAQWFRASGPYTLEECEQMAAAKVAHRAAHGFGWSLAWEGKACVGWSGAQHCIVDGISEVELGWAVAQTHWRRGIGTRLGEVALAEVTPLDLRGVIAYTREDNAASRGVMTKLGMSYEKRFEHRDLPHVLYRKALRSY